MPNIDRLEQIAAIVEERGFATVSGISQQLGVSEMTVRRDLAFLDENKRLQRTYGGAASLRSSQPSFDEDGGKSPIRSKAEPLLERVDVLISTSVNPKFDRLLQQSILGNKSIPLIAESLSIHNQKTVVAIDNHQAGFELGQWAGEYAAQHWDGQARILDLTYYLENTQTRSRGFAAGVRAVLPTAEIVLSLDAQSRYETAYQLTIDALTVHEGINLIFAINDTIARGALDACRALNRDPEQILVLPFGLEGDAMKNALMAGDYCQVGLAMFPEVVGPVCIEAAIAAFNHLPLSQHLVTPFAVLSRETLPQYYELAAGSWRIRREAAANLASPIPIGPQHSREGLSLPSRIGFIIPFSEHEWYRNLTACMKSYAHQLRIDFEIVDADQSLKDEIDLRRRAIAHLAASQVQPGEVILIDGGPIAVYLAEELARQKSLTIITNSIAVFDAQRSSPGNMIILTGGAYRHSSQMMVGPTAEGALSELRADKLFLTVTGISQNFGLSHTNISEVTIKQAMLRSAREVILLADHTIFGQESVVQVADLHVVHRVITDDALPASTRLDLTKLGIQILLAST